MWLLFYLLYILITIQTSYTNFDKDPRKLGGLVLVFVPSVKYHSEALLVRVYENVKQENKICSLPSISIVLYDYHWESLKWQGLKVTNSSALIRCFRYCCYQYLVVVNSLDFYKKTSLLLLLSEHPLPVGRLQLMYSVVVVMSQLNPYKGRRFRVGIISLQHCEASVIFSFLVVEFFD